MGLMAIPALFLLARSVCGSYGQTARCYTAMDPATRPYVSEFLKNVSICASQGHGIQTIRCAEEQIPRQFLSLLTPITNNVRTWELYYRTDLDAAFQRYGRDAYKAALYDIAPHDENAWTMVARSWMLTGWLCMWDNHPMYADHLEPRHAGLLTIFFSPNDDAWPPLAKTGKRWRYTRGVICSKREGDERDRHAKVINEMSRAAGDMHTIDAWRELSQDAFNDRFSTDPFLQAVITGWQSGPYRCPTRMTCQRDGLEKGTVFLPKNSGEYLSALAARFRLQGKVCVIFRNASLDSENYYITAPTISEGPP